MKKYINSYIFSGTTKAYCLQRPECIFLISDLGCSSLSSSVHKSEKFKIPKSKKTCISSLTNSSYSREDGKYVLS